MKIEALKRRIDRIAARRMIRESEEFFGPSRPSNPVWRETLCDWCGKEYTAPNLRICRHYCSPECQESAAMSSKNVKLRLQEEQRRRESRQKPKERITPVERKLLRKLAQDGRKQWLTREVAEVGGMNGSAKVNSAHARLVNLEIAGCVIRGEIWVKGKMVRTWALDEEAHEVKQARAWKESK